MKPAPVTAKGRRSRDAIVEAAARLMHDRGIAATSLDDVLTASDTGKSQLYHYFDDKQDLTVAVLHLQFERVLAAQPCLRDPACHDLGRWRDEVLLAHRVHQFGNCPLGVFAGQVDDSPVLRGELRALFDQWRQAIGELAGRALRHGRVRADVDPAGAGLVLLSALQGGTMLSHLHGDAEPLTRALNGAIAQLT
ncbi:MAG: TetR/AcrR family transcriptional regulator, transcriptional repressor for nem operon [Pseudonocardiales bacterium]|nr:TetR/AcrR family transcriptional regulator, transcriptional repressor for nem operon [Pseudonocardiales bacterium]